MCQAFLAETLETGTKNRCVIEAMLFCEQSLGKIKFRAFPKHVGPRIVSVESVDYFGTMNTTEWWKKNNLNQQNCDGRVL